MRVSSDNLQGVINKGFDFLDAEICESGAHPSMVHDKLELKGKTKEEHVAFVAAPGSISLLECVGTRSART